MEGLTTTTLSPPYRRSYSLDCSDTGTVWLFGGCCDDKEVVFGDLWGLWEGKWHYETVGEEEGGVWPPARYGHASIFVPKSAPGPLAGHLVIYGGRCRGGKLLDDLWGWNEETQKWRLLTNNMITGSGSGIKLMGIQNQFARPQPSCYSTLTLISEGRLLLFGGQTDKAIRGSKMMWLLDVDGSWRKLSHFEKRPRRFRHCAWYDHAQKRFNIYGGISGSAWHVDVCSVSLADLNASTHWRILPAAAGLIVPGHSIQSEVCVSLDASRVLVLGTTSAFVLEISGNHIRAVGLQKELPTIWKGNSPGVQACLVHPGTVLLTNLLSKQVNPLLEIAYNLEDETIQANILELKGIQASGGKGLVFHRPPKAPLLGHAEEPRSRFLVWLQHGRWERWNGEAVDYFQLPAADAGVGAGSTSGEPSETAARENSATVVSSGLTLLDSQGSELQSFHDSRHRQVFSVGSLNDASGTEDDLEGESMPLLYVRQQKRRSILKRFIDLLVEWEKRGAVEFRKRRPRLDQRPEENEDLFDDEQDLDCFGRSDEDRKEFDVRHFFFTILRGLFIWVFAIFYLFSSRFTARVKIFLLLAGLVNIGVFAMPVVSLAWPDAKDLRAEAALVWAPLVLYVLLVLVQASVEGNWRDNGGSAASIKYLDGYSCQVFIKQMHNSSRRTVRAMGGGELMTNLIEYEESVMPDPWEYWFLCFILSPFLGLVKAGLFILVDYLLVSHQVISLDDPVWVHVVFAISMLLNALTTTVFLSVLAISAYVYRRQLRLLRLVSAIISKRKSAKLGLPFLPLRSLANVRVWSAMRTFSMSDKSYLPLTSANAVTGYSLVVLGVLWVVLTVSVFVERSRAQLLVPLNISLGFFAFVLFYFSFVSIRQHLLINKQLRSHTTIVGRERIRVQLAIDLRGEKGLEPTNNLLLHISDLLKIELSFFRLMGAEINQNSLNSMLGFMLTLSVATITNVVLDVASGSK